MCRCLQVPALLTSTGLRPRFSFVNLKRLETVSSKNSKLEELIEPLVSDLGYEFVGLELHRQPRHSLLRLYIDAESGISLDDCERVSHEVSALMDVEDPIRGTYQLEVSSPGMDRPLFNLPQFNRFAGEEVKITVFAPIDGRRRFKGKILGVTEDAVRLEQDGEEVEIPGDGISKARLVPQFD